VINYNSSRKVGELWEYGHETFPRDVSRGRGVQEDNILGEGPPPKIWEGKIRRDFRQLSTLIANISRTEPHIENRKEVDQLQSLPRWAKKDGELWSTNKKVLGAPFDPPKLHFSEDYISALKGCWPLKY